MYGCPSATTRYNANSSDKTPMIFENDACNGTINTSRTDVNLVLRFKEHVLGETIEFLAASPPDYRETFTGSGLPFATKTQAFQETPNNGTVRVINGEAHINMFLPNSYYEDFNTLVGPYVDIMYKTYDDKERHLTIKLGNAVPYRSLSYPDARVNKQQGFYDGGFELPVRTQEQVLYASAYPSKNTVESNFWGYKPRQ